MKTNWERAGNATGILMVLALVAVILLTGGMGDAGQPGRRPTGSELATFSEKNYDTINLVRFLNAVMGFFLIWFAGSVREAIARTESNGARLANISFAGGLLMGLLLWLTSSLDRAVTDHVVGGDFTEETVSVFATLTLAVDKLLPFAAGIFVGSAALAALRFGSFPKWLGWLSVLVALVTLVGALSVLWQSSPESGFRSIDVVPFTFLWILLTSIVLVISPARSGSQTQT